MFMLRSVLIVIVLTLYAAPDAVAQGDRTDLVQFSGIIMSSDSLIGIPYAHIMIKNVNRGTISNYQGFFSFVSAKGDTIVMSAVGYKKKVFVIPDTLVGDKHSVIQLMTRDTIHIPETIIYPWPTPEEFREAFLALDIPDDDLDRARKNLERERLKELGLAMTMDANENRDYYLRQESARFYYNGQLPPIRIFDPLRWAEFLKAWQRGDFKRKK